MSSPTLPSPTLSSSASVIRRYTPPTCTLEIAAKDSPLSRWIGQSVLKHLRFKLSFDDPRISEDQWITIGGDRAQLQSLCDAVTQYVQNFLSQSNHLLNGTRSAVAANPTAELRSASPETTSTGIYLRPKGLISHELHLGSLATDRSGSIIRLSAVQLADLAQALDEYSADVTALPNLDRPRWISSPPAWGAVAAAAVVAVGITASIVRFFEPSATPQTASNTSQGASSNDQRLAVQPLPNTASPTPLPLPVAPLPSSSLPPITAPTAPAQPTPKLTVKPEAPVSNPAPINIPVREVPVAGIPNQTTSSTTKPSTTRSARSADSSIASASQSAPTAPIASSKIAALNAPVEPASVLAAQGGNATAVPQVAEARTYFKSRWQPPKELTETIEYRLLLAPDGTIQNIVPLGDAADKFLDRTPMPLTGEKFVSPIQSGKPPLLRLVLSPNGNVQTFLEPQ